jgi:hypothetical protein
VPLTNHRPDVPVELGAVVLKCLAKTPTDRYADVRSLDADLAECTTTTVRQWTGADAAEWWQHRVRSANPVSVQVARRRHKPLPVADGASEGQESDLAGEVKAAVTLRKGRVRTSSDERSPSAPKRPVRDADVMARPPSRVVIVGGQAQAGDALLRGAQEPHPFDPDWASKKSS